MTKNFGLVLLALAAACLLAGVYGAVHNQISYTVCPEYFTKFKFIQFRLSDALQSRQGASFFGAVVGILVGMVTVARHRVTSTLTSDPVTVDKLVENP
jgi:hypothetical protein